ncbi:LysR family transcriptional regulator [Pararhodospirillum photometricum]|nr:LysR family transcriptional regulator [Pararhodospirillum photometricum]
MTLDQLRVFVAVAERQNVTQGAAALNLAQSAASHAIATLEARHGVRLFDRLGRRVVLTEAGRVFLIEARQVLAQADAADRALAELAGLRRGTLRIAASQTIAGYWLPRHLVALRLASPGLTLALTVANTAGVAAAVAEGAADLGFIEGALERTDLVATPVARDQLVIVVAPCHPWADGRSLTPTDLRDAVWVLRESGSGTRAVFEAALTDLGITAPTVGMVLPSNEAVRAAVEAGFGATALSASVAAAGLEAGLLVRARYTLPDRAFSSLHHPARTLSHAARALLNGIGT